MNDKFSLLKRMRRLSGILVHPTSLPGKFGIGDLGPEAYRFVDFLQESGQHLWQTLPLGPTGGHNSPYQCFSSFAGQPLLISPELLKDEGLLTDADLSNVPHFSDEEVDFAAVGEYKKELFKKAFARFKELPEDNPLKSELALFCKSAHWLDDFAMFMAIKKSKGGAHWLEWEKKYRKPTKSQKAVIEREFEDEILYEKFLQWTFCRQWSQLKAYANERDILLIGDIPIFVSGDSADVWAEPRLFQLDSDGFPTVVAGVPPDYFSATGQLWGNPLYDWKYHKKTNYEWWMERFKTQFLLSDIVRIDHFRGLESYWEIPADSETALNGKWVDGPKDEFFEVLIKTFEEPPIIAEDLGIITDDVRALRDKFGLPGMKILQFAFEDEDSNYLPYNQPYNCVCYTGTHDNDTTTGWYATASEKARDKVRRYMNTDASQVSWDFIRTCFGSPARFAIIPVQDLFCQGSDCRMNTPGKADGNWAYRMKKELLTSDVAKRLYDVTKLYGR
mgnify:CR=1 FL=1